MAPRPNQHEVPESGLPAQSVQVGDVPHALAGRLPMLLNESPLTWGVAQQVPHRWSA